MRDEGVHATLEARAFGLDGDLRQRGRTLGRRVCPSSVGHPDEYHKNCQDPEHTISFALTPQQCVRMTRIPYFRASAQWRVVPDCELSNPDRQVLRM